MKRCPQCRRDYYDESLTYCLDDGTVLLNGPAIEENPTALLPERVAFKEDRTKLFSAADRLSGGVLPQKNNRKTFLFIAGLLLLASVGAVSYLFVGRSGSGGRQIDTIAVMPFVNDGNADMEYLSDGMTESLIGSLSQISNLNVRARSSVFRYKGKEFDVQKIGNELNVEALLTGEVAQHGSDISLFVELIDAATNSVIWSGRYDRPLTNLIVLQRDLARDVSNELKAKLSGSDEQKLAKVYTTNVEAFDLYMQGRYYWNKRNGQDVLRSVDYFKQAIDLDPNYALAYAGLADAYSIVPSYASGRPDEYFPKAKAAAQRALELDESLAEAHTALARVLFAYDWNFAESDNEYRRAIELNPNYPTAHHWYGDANLLRTGRFEEAIAELRRAREIDPLSLAINTDLGEAYMLTGRYDEAIAQLTKTVAMDERFHYAHHMLGQAYQLKGLLPAAIAEYERARQLSTDPYMIMLLAQAYALKGDRVEAVKYLSELKDVSVRVYVPPTEFAVVYTALGDHDQAFQWLDKSFQDRGQELTRLKIDPFLDPLRDDSRFKELIKKVGLPE